MGARIAFVHVVYVIQIVSMSLAMATQTRCVRRCLLCDAGASRSSTRYAAPPWIIAQHTTKHCCLQNLIKSRQSVIACCGSSPRFRAVLQAQRYRRAAQRRMAYNRALAFRAWTLAMHDGDKTAQCCVRVVLCA